MNDKQKNLLLSKIVLKGDKQKDIAEVLNISNQALQNKLNGTTGWSQADIMALSKRYELTPDEEHDIFLT